MDIYSQLPALDLATLNVKEKNLMKRYLVFVTVVVLTVVASGLLLAQSNTQVGSSPASTSDAGFAQEILKAHNLYRCQHGVPPLLWNADVAAYAQNWVNKMGRVVKHSKSYDSPLGPMGENLYWGSAQPSVTDAVKSWYSEVSSYKFGSEGLSANRHFTAMIWKDAKYLGCGRANWTISCNYWSGTKTYDCTVPNMDGCYSQQVRPRSRDAEACK
jgi:hypothetical protein